MTKTPDLSIDFETASVCDLRRAGVYTYAEDPTTQILCMAWAIGDEPVQVWRQGDPFPDRVKDHVARGRRVRAWNAQFEWVIWNETLRRRVQGLPDLSLSQLEDTMAAAAVWGLPLSLDQAGSAAGVKHTKDKQGHALMMRMCRPRSFDAEGNPVWWHETDPEKFDRLCAYCATDVEVERAVGDVIPDLPPDERQTWEMDQLINRAGVGVDYVLVERLRDLSEEAAKRTADEITRLTNGQVTSINQHRALLEWLQFHGYPHDNLRRATVEARLDDTGLSDTERAGLELRLDAARTSAAKLNAMLGACTTRGGVGAVRGMLQYYGASRTGRWAGRLIQLQNMPRGVIKNIASAVELILHGAGVDELEALFGPVMGVISSCLRACIVARPGRKLVVADFSQIEARVVAWLAGQDDVLAVFVSGEDVYVYTAAKIGSKDRQLGKVLTLACGFGMSGSKFKDTAEGYGIFMSEDEAKAAVDGWRESNSRIVSFWWDCDRAARTVIANPTQVVTVGQVRFGMWGPHMVIRLPSGRPLIYRTARLRDNPDRPGTTEITYMGMNQYTRKWERVRTYGGKLVENITQAVARDVMRDAMREAKARSIPLTLTVHDELITEPAEAQADVTFAALLAVMRTPPKWGQGIPVDADGWVGDRYRK